MVPKHNCTNALTRIAVLAKGPKWGIASWYQNKAETKHKYEGHVNIMTERDGISNGYKYSSWHVNSFRSTLSVMVTGKLIPALSSTNGIRVSLGSHTVHLIQALCLSQPVDLHRITDLCDTQDGLIAVSYFLHR